MNLKHVWRGGPHQNISVQVDEASGEVFITNLLAEGRTVQVRPRTDWPGHLVVSSPTSELRIGDDEGEPAVIIR